MPVYDFVTHSRRADQVRKVEAADVVIVEGILVLHDEALRAHLNMKVRAVCWVCWALCWVLCAVGAVR